MKVSNILACDYQHTINESFQFHIVLVQDGHNFTCEQCNFQVTSRTRFKIHKEAEHNGIQYSCDQCDHVSKAKKSLNIHNKIKHGILNILVTNVISRQEVEAN